MAKATVNKGTAAMDGSAAPAELTDWEWYEQQVRRQEEMYVRAGFPADGLADFLVKWIQGWQDRSVTQLRECMADNLVYADSTIGSRTWSATQLEIDLYGLFFKLFPDMEMLPQDRTKRSLPYFDFLDGEVRMTVPYAGVGRPRFTPRRIRSVGVDRYNLVRDPRRGWLIERIDTDCDLFFTLGAILPVPLRPPTQRTFQRGFGLLQRAIPSLKGPRVRPFVHNGSIS